MTMLKTRKVFAAAACSLALLGVAACGIYLLLMNKYYLMY